jgi:hypothetical protein
MMAEMLWSVTQVVVVLASICNMLSWAAMAFALRYYAPYPRGETSWR